MPHVLVLFLAWCLAQPALAVTSLRPFTSPLLRADHALNNMRLSPKGRFVAYVGDDGLGLSVLDLKTRAIFQVSSAQVGLSFFWSPDGYRLFYRELVVDDAGQTSSLIKAYDCALARSIKIDRLPSSSGILTFDPRDLRLAILSPKGISTKRIYFPDERLGRWQVAQRIDKGKWLATQTGILWVSQGGFAMRQLPDDESGLDSFAISPDGQWLAWATKAGRIYMTQAGRAPAFIGYGRDPSWHPEKPLLVYSAARMVGNTAVSYDLRLADRHGEGRFLTATQLSDERWPHWDPKGHKIYYTVAKTTDIYELDFKQ